MDATTALVSVCLLLIGGCLGWYGRGWMEEQMVTAEFEAENDDDEGE